ncbi:hypothetical protein GPECTOR_16g763 [Gonium pectorale]|uniref:Calpain catalytic domain-containing protein n=1 Tax=Gonium pectorale TaxID=33097 RepID=A0A150GLD0_GONPE|nr:hypothetical protein GPECTOR_16g763 [Gonium pectorale]|eukprot:KXZ50588.1 hypothetical protein GPECTOR_16g763 [Gonium pectorale]
MYVSDRALPPEDVTVSTIESLLRIPSLASGRTEEQLVASYSGDDGMVTDPDFLPGVSSLFPDPNQPPATAPPDVTWRRVSGTLYFPTGKTARLLQGVLDSGCFLGALAAVAAIRGGELLLDLIVSDDAAGAGAYTFQLFKHGCWQAVVVDNYLPCLAGQERLAFACSAVVGELWPSLLEKAYAKVHGSYYALAGGSVTEALVDLTGGVGWKVKHEGDAERDALWANLQGWLSSKSIVACVAKRKAPARYRFRPDAVDPDPDAPERPPPPPAADEPVAGDGSGPEGPHGLLAGQVYSVLEARTLPGGTRLGSPEWTSPVAAQMLDSFSASFEDEATFWMPFEEFAAFFNRLHVCRMFPPTWHQLTLHCGWQGPSAGGPYLAAPSESTFGPPGSTSGSGAAATERAGGDAAGPGPGSASVAGLSSTWCCNPQFRLTVRKAAEVVVCLGQQDPTVAARAHVPKRLRKKAIGMQILRVPLDSLGRRWEVRPGELVANVPCRTDREVLASFKALPEYAYVVVPHAGRAGEEGAFVLRTLSSGPLEVEQLPAPLCLLVGGTWSGFLAGGGRHCTSWGSNPQYMVSCSQRAQVVASLSRLDLKYSVIKGPRDPALDLDLVLTSPQIGPEGPGRRAAIRESEVVAAAAAFMPAPGGAAASLAGAGVASFAGGAPGSMAGGQQLVAASRDGGAGGGGATGLATGSGSNEEVVLSVVLEPETPYLLVPSITTPGVEAPYELRLMSGVPLELVPLPEMQAVTLPGEWTPESAGGCNVHPLWRRNPKYLLVLLPAGGGAGGGGGVGRVRLNLRRPAGGKARHPVDDMLGLYVLRAAGPDGEIKVRGDKAGRSGVGATPRKAVVAESTFVPQPEVTADYELAGGSHYIIMPCTYGPGRTGRFTLAVSSTTPFQFRSLQQ